jgi:hypothetical protein
MKKLILDYNYFYKLTESRFFMSGRNDYQKEVSGGERENWGEIIPGVGVVLAVGFGGMYAINHLGNLGIAAAAMGTIGSSCLIYNDGGRKSGVLSGLALAACFSGSLLFSSPNDGSQGDKERKQDVEYRERFFEQTTPPIRERD